MVTKEIEKPIKVAMTSDQFNSINGEIKESLTDYAGLHNKYADEVRYGSFPVMFNWSDMDESYVGFNIWYDQKGFMMVDASGDTERVRSSLLEYAASVVEFACKRNHIGFVASGPARREVEK